MEDVACMQNEFIKVKADKSCLNSLIFFSEMKLPDYANETLCYLEEKTL